MLMLRVVQVIIDANLELSSLSLEAATKLRQNRS